MKKPREKHAESTQVYNFSILLPRQCNRSSIRVQVCPVGERILLPRRQSKIFPNDGCCANRNKNAIQSLRVSRQRIQEQQRPNIQFSKASAVAKNRHARTQSNKLYYPQSIEEQMSNFSNSLDNISQEVIEIPFANRVIGPRKRANLISHSNKTNGIMFSKKAANKSSAKNSRNNSQDKKTLPSAPEANRSVQRKQNKKRVIPDKPANRFPQSYPKCNTFQQTHGYSKVKFSDFNVKAIKITKHGSIIYMAMHKSTNSLFALKSIKKAFVKQNLSEFTAKLKLGLLLTNPNIIKIYGFFSDEDNFYILEEFMEQGCIVDSQARRSQQQIASSINQVFNAVLYLIPILNFQYWYFSQSNICKTHGICKISNLYFDQTGSRDHFSSQMRQVLSFLTNCHLGKEQRWADTADSIIINEHTRGNHSLSQFRKVIEQMGHLDKPSLLDLWEHRFLKQFRLSSLMRSE